MSYVTKDVPVGDPEFGKAFLCPACHGGPIVSEAKERNRERRLALLSNYGLAETTRHSWLTWEHFTEAYLGELWDGKDTAVECAQRWAHGETLTYSILGIAHALARMEPTSTRFRPANSLYLCGPAGTGKTGLGYLAYKTRQSVTGEPGVFVEFAKLYEAIKGQYGSRNESYQLIQAVATAPLLFLDDLGHAGRRVTDDQFDKAWQIINERYTRELPTLITSNLTRLDLGDFLGPKISGRVAEMCLIVPMVGPALREAE